jgi:hypothetical protein
MQRCRCAEMQTRWMFFGAELLVLRFIRRADCAGEGAAEDRCKQGAKVQKRCRGADKK